MNLFQKLDKKTRKILSNLLLGFAVAIFLATGGVAASKILAIQSEYHTAENEYDDIRLEVLPPRTSSGTDTEVPAEEEPEEIIDLTHINSDYVGWIQIEDTKIDYPVVQGSDNSKYLYTTFKGTINSSGAIFLDANCQESFGSSLTIIYGHNMKNGTMFSGLRSYYTEKQYMDEHPVITIRTPKGEKLVYEILKIKITDGNDAVYFLPGREQSVIDKYFTAQKIEEDAPMLVLSTCTNRSADIDERLLVFAVRTDVVI